MKLPPPFRKTLMRWTLGLAFATALAWAVAPSLTDSMVVRRFDKEIQDSLWQPNQTVRWRSEGWGTTRIGAEGLPGWSSEQRGQRILLWGDSQVEGFCVPDAMKLHAIARAKAEEEKHSFDFVPCGRSGTDARVWLQWKPVMEARFEPEFHILVVSDWSDLLHLSSSQPNSPLPPTDPRIEQIAKLHGELFFHTAKKILWDANANRVRKLDWRLIPRSSNATDAPTPSTASPTDPAAAVTDPISLIVERLADANTQGKPLAIVYVPEVPQVQSLHTIRDPHRDMALALQEKLSAKGIEMTNLEEELIESYQSTGQLPRGFHNGYPGLGHLNLRGNQIVAAAIVRLTIEHFSPASVTAP